VRQMKTILEKLFIGFIYACMAALLWCWASLSISQRRLATPMEALDKFEAVEGQVMEKTAGPGREK
jgi:hypothetical protein